MSDTRKAEEESTYYIESLVPSFLASDGGYIAVLKKYLFDIVSSQEWTVMDGPRRTWKSAGQILVEPPTGFVEVHIEVTVREFDTWVD